MFVNFMSVFSLLAFALALLWLGAMGFYLSLTLSHSLSLAGESRKGVKKHVFKKL